MYILAVGAPCFRTVKLFNNQHLQQNYRTMVRQICNIKPEEVVRPRELLAKLSVNDLDLILIESRLILFGYNEGHTGTLRTACDMRVDGKRGSGRPKMTWKEND